MLQNYNPRVSIKNAKYYHRLKQESSNYCFSQSTDKDWWNEAQISLKSQFKFQELPMPYFADWSSSYRENIGFAMILESKSKPNVWTLPY